MASFVRLEHATKAYHTGDIQLIALDSISVTFARGQFSIVVGKSGAGKSTLVNMISGVDNLTSGQLWVGETAVHALSEDERAR